MFDLATGLRADRGLYVGGGLRDLRTQTFGNWVCIANHPCLQAVGASHSDRMCYAVERRGDKETVLHAWGLASQVKVDANSCASNRRQN